MVTGGEHPTLYSNHYHMVHMCVKLLRTEALNHTRFGAPCKHGSTIKSSEMNLVIHKLSRWDQLMVTKCVVWECSRVVRTTELHGMTACRIKLTEIAIGDDER
jgi:hypothetical protein